MFTPEDRRRVLDTILVPALKAKKYDEGVSNAVDAIGSALSTNAGRSASVGQKAPGATGSGAAPTPSGRGGGTICGTGSIGGWICVGVGVLVIFMIIRGFTRRMSGSGYNQPGYGQPGYGQPGGGGWRWIRRRDARWTPRRRAGRRGIRPLQARRIIRRCKHPARRAHARPIRLCTRPQRFRKQQRDDFDSGSSGGDFGGGDLGGGDGSSSGSDF